MGFSEYIKSIFPTSRKKLYNSWISDNNAIFSSFGNDIYMSDFVNNAIDRIASEISKIDIKSVVEKDDTIKIQNDDITRLFKYKPNPLQTTSDFLSCVEWLRRKNRNVFIYPQYEIIKIKDGREFKRYTAFYPINPSDIEIGINNGDAWEIKFNFEDGTSYVLPYNEIIHLKWRRGKNTIIGGGDDFGQVQDKELVKVINSLDKTIQGLPKSIEASVQIKGVYSAKTLADQRQIKNIRDDFEKHIFDNSSGIVATDLAGDFTPVNINPAQIDKTTMQFLKSVIQERYGISERILNGDFNGEEHEAFYQSVIEDFIIQFEQAMTSALFSQREQDVGHRIKCYYNKVMYLSTSDKIQIANLAKETGIMTLNQI
ncbi:MAG: phage portal protein, partial [Acutalibacteraceae bacterium]